MDVARDARRPQNVPVIVAPEDFAADRPSFRTRAVTGLALELLLIDHRLAGLDDFLLVGKKLRGQFLRKKIKVTLALHFLRRGRSQISGMGRVIQYKPSLLVFRINVVRQMINHQPQQIPLFYQPFVDRHDLCVFRRGAATPHHRISRHHQPRQANRQRPHAGQ